MGVYFVEVGITCKSQFFPPCGSQDQVAKLRGLEVERPESLQDPAFSFSFFKVDYTRCKSILSGSFMPQVIVKWGSAGVLSVSE